MRKWWSTVEPKMKVMILWLIAPVIIVTVIGLVLIWVAPAEFGMVTALSSGFVVIVFGCRVLFGPKVRDEDEA